MWLFISGTRQKKNNELWQSWDQVIEESSKSNKPIFINVYTDWCRYCKVMDATTLKNDSVVSFLKNNFLRFKMDGEGKDTIKWNNKIFTYNKRYKTHDFAVYLTRGSIAYPTTVIISPGGQPFYKQGFINVAEMELLLKYFSQPAVSRISFEDYARTFNSTWLTK